jgi:hypothetical protein
MSVLTFLFKIRNRQDRLQRGYIELAKSLPWFHERLATLDHEESEDMLRKVIPTLMCHIWFLFSM